LFLSQIILYIECIKYWEISEISAFDRITLEDDYLIIEPIQKPRNGWDEKFAIEKSKGKDELLIPDVFDDEELLPWE